MPFLTIDRKPKLVSQGTALLNEFSELRFGQFQEGSSAAGDLVPTMNLRVMGNGHFAWDGFCATKRMAGRQNKTEDFSSLSALSAVQKRTRARRPPPIIGKVKKIMNMTSKFSGDLRPDGQEVSLFAGQTQVTEKKKTAGQWRCLPSSNSLRARANAMPKTHLSKPAADILGDPPWARLFVRQSTL